MAYNHLNSSCNKSPFQLPSQCRFIKVLGEGSFGTVVKCWKKDTREAVAVKIPKFFDEETINEVSMLREFRRLNLDKKNIVKFIDSFHTKFGKAIMFEALDISIEDYVQRHRYAPMLLSDIRTIIQQVATAFDALKRIGVIRTDIKPDNIMMVNHWKRPFKVKLIDFGLAMPTSNARPGIELQPVVFRSPEIILGLPFCEAIDMWSLGIVMAFMICGADLFPAESDYELLENIIEFLGQPARHLLQTGRRTKYYFNQTKTNNWRLKTPQEYFGGPRAPRFLKLHAFDSLDEMKDIREERNNKFEAVEREESIELLKAMLQMDANERITPRQVLSHPFIVNDSSNRALTSTRMKSLKTSIKKMPRPKAAHIRRNRVAPLPPDVGTIVQPDSCTLSPTIQQIKVQPAMAETMLQLEDLDSELDETSESPTKVSKSDTKTLASMDSTHSITPEDITPQKTGKKRKNCFRRIFSWMKKTLTTCRTSTKDEGCPK